MNNIIWIKTPKCAGTSFLEPFRNTNVVKVGWGYVKQHKHQITAESFDTAYKFAFVRNPYDRLVSSYSFSVKQGWFTGNFKQFVKTPLHNLHPQACQHTQPLTLHLSIDKLEYRRHCFEFHPDQSEPTIDYLNYIGRFENLQEDFNFVCDKIGLPRQHLYHKNATKHKYYTEYYDDETRAIVEERYAKDIEYFGYTYGD